MRKSVLATVVAFSLLLVGCDKSEDNVVSESEKVQQQIFEEYGIKPSEADLINNILYITDADGCKLAFGKKDNKAWYAKFKRTGEQIYSYELETNLSLDYDYSHCNASSDMLISNNKIFLQCYLTNEDDPESLVFFFHSVLVVIDFEKGTVISKLESQKSGWEFKNLKESDYCYFIESADWQQNGTVHSYHVFNLDGTILWERETKAGEDEGVDGYSLNYFKDTNTIIYCEGLVQESPNGYIQHGNFLLRSLNLKEYKIVSEKLIALDGENKDQSNIIYSDILMNKEEGNIKITYKEKESTYRSNLRKQNI